MQGTCIHWHKVVSTCADTGMSGFDRRESETSQSHNTMEETLDELKVIRETVNFGDMFPVSMPFACAESMIALTIFQKCAQL
eukprot:2244047-Amphidinium_carterae.1